MLYGVSLFVLFVCVFACLCVVVLRVMYGAMEYGLYFVVVLVCVVDNSVGVICVRCIVCCCMGCSLCWCVVVRMGFNVFECVFMLELVCDVVWYDCCHAFVFVRDCVLYLL